MTITEQFVDFSESVTFDRLSADVLEKATLLILDTIGVCIASSRMDFGTQVLDLAAEWHAGTGCHLVGREARVAPHHAALVNGVLGHGQDYDDTHTESVVHSSGGLVPAMLACAERDGASGRAALAAFVAATEMSIRLALPARNAFHIAGFHTTSVACTFGAALLSSMTGRRSHAHRVQALGICGSFASGLLECVPAASSAKRLHAGWAGLCGLMADDFARAGFTGPASVIEGRLGVYKSMLRGQDFDLREMFAGIGEQWEILNVRPKLYPCCHYLQAFIDCAARLRTPDFEHRRIKAIRCRVAAGSVNMICEPWANKLAPKTGYDARFSLPYAIATMLVRGRAGYAEFQETALDQPDILALMGKVSYEIDPTFTVKDMPAFVEIEYEDGSRALQSLSAVRGDAAQPISSEEILAKFHACTAEADSDATKRIAEQVMALETLPDLADLMQALARLAEPQEQTRPRLSA